MNISNAELIINTICDRIGIVINSASDFIPKLAQYKKANAIFWMVAAPAIICISVFLTIYTFKRAKKIIEAGKDRFRTKYTDFLSVLVVTTLCGISLFASGIIFLNAVQILIRWSIAPEVATVEYILGMLSDTW